MMMIFRYVLSGILLSTLLTLMVLVVTFIVFPLDDWSLIWETTVYDLSFLYVIGIFPVVVGMIVGGVIGWNHRQRLQYIHRQLDDLLKGQMDTQEDLTYKELTFIQEKISDIQQHLRKQTELAQKIATERAEEREKGLQEVVMQERNRLARELHDSVSQQLFAASMMMTAINEANPPEDPQLQHQLSLVEKMIHQSQLEMRALLLHLRPVALKGKSLQEGIKTLLTELTEKVPMEVTWHIEDFPISKGIEDQLFRILQESVSNTLRHAKADSLEVMLIERDSHIILRVVDDGIGFNVEDVRAGSYGLQNMRERALEVGGTCKIISLPNQGTRLEVKVPQVESEGDE